MWSSNTTSCNCSNDDLQLSSGVSDFAAHLHRYCKNRSAGKLVFFSFACGCSFNRVPLLSWETSSFVTSSTATSVESLRDFHRMSTDKAFRCRVIAAFPAEFNYNSTVTPPCESWLSSDFTSHQTTAFFSKRMKRGEKRSNVSILSPFSLFFSSSCSNMTK